MAYPVRRNSAENGLRHLTLTNDRNNGKSDQLICQPDKVGPSHGANRSIKESLKQHRGRERKTLVGDAPSSMLFKPAG